MDLSRVVALAALLTATVGLGGCELALNSWNAEARDGWERSYTLGAEGRFELTNTNGGITVEPSPDGQVHVKAEKIARAATEPAAREALKQIEILEDVGDTVVRVETKTQRTSMFGGGGLQVSYVVRVPSTVAVKVENTNGRIELTDLPGAVDAETTNGGVRGRGLRGAVRAETTNGGVDLDVAAVAEGGIDVSTTNGGVKLALPADAKADVSASCVNGGVDAGDLELEPVESSRRRLEGRLNGGGPRVRAETTNGGVSFRRR
jgi:hypothetical protein